jgi:hypothetical protein
VLDAFKDAGQPEYFRVVEILADLQRTGAVGMRVEKRGDDDTAVMFVRKEGAGREELRELRELLGLDPNADQYQLVYGALPTKNTEIALLTKSALEIMVELARWADVPEEHVAAKRTRPSQVAREIGGHRVEQPLRIHHGSSVPPTAFVATEFRGTNFWIEDGDLLSKRTFAFLELLFSMVDTNARQLAPVITVGAGG